VRSSPARDRRPSQIGDLYELRCLIANVDTSLERFEDPYRSESSARPVGSGLAWRLWLRFYESTALILDRFSLQVGVTENHLFTFLRCSGTKLHDALVNLVDGALSSCKLFLTSTALKSLICCCVPFHAASVRL
jgi:hypothetical protein